MHRTDFIPIYLRFFSIQKYHKSRVWSWVPRRGDYTTLVVRNSYNDVVVTI